MDADTNDIVTNGLGNCITRDGQGQPSANLPMATFRHTGVSDGVARTDYASVGQSQDGKINWVAAGGTPDAIAATYSPAITALVDGQLCFVRASGANTITTPTFAPNGLTARTITKIGGSALAAGDINGADHELILRYKLASTRWELLNPSGSNIVSTDAGASVGPIFDVFRDSASPAASDFIGAVDFNGRDSAANKQLYAEIIAQITDPVSTTEDANLILRAVVAGTLTDMLTTTAAGISIPGKLSLPNITTPLAMPGSTTANRSGSPTEGDIRYNTTLHSLEYWSGSAWVQNTGTPRGYIDGFTIANNAAQSVDIAAGVCRSDDDTVDIRLTASITAKSLASTWAAGSSTGGLDTGAVSSSSTYAVFAIYNPTSLVSDIVFSKSTAGSFASPTMPSGYTKKRYIGSILTDGSGNITVFTQVGDEFLITTPIANITNTAPGDTSAHLVTLSVPLGIKLQSIINVAVGGGGANVYVSSPDQTDGTPSVTAAPGAGQGAAGATNSAARYSGIRTDTSGRVRYRMTSSQALTIVTLGWIDQRGKNA